MATFARTALFALLTLSMESVAQQAPAQPIQTQQTQTQQTQTQQTSAPPSAPHKRPVKARKKAVPDPPPVPAPPPPPPTLEQMPAVPPEVRYNRGQLTIAAQNSTLADILRAVHAQTGAAIEIPPNSTERVATHLGPGPARDVLAALLNGSHFNYVMVGSPSHPESVERLILTSKSGGVEAQAVAAPAASPQVQMDDAAADAAEPAVDDAAENSAAGDNAQQQPEGQAPVKTPEQLLRELQQQQQLQQQQPQQQQQQPQQQPTPPPPSSSPTPGPPN